MDNFHIDITAEGRKNLEWALNLAFHQYSASHYAVIPKIGLVFFWHEPSSVGLEASKLPFKMDAKSALTFVEQWLNQTPYGSRPDHDGDNHHGWRVYNDSWGMVSNHMYSFVAVQPAWAMYGK